MSLGSNYPNRINPNVIGFKKGNTITMFDGSIIKNCERIYPRSNQCKGILVFKVTLFKNYKIGNEVTFSITNAFKVYK